MRSAQSVELFVSFVWVLIACVSTHQGGSSHHGIDRNAIQDEGHIKDHLDGKVNTDEKMTVEELQFHYFKQHDYDDNSKLDGLEIISAITHVHKDTGSKTNSSSELQRMTDEELSSTVDSILSEADLNGDGYVNYAEFITVNRPQS